MSGVEEKGAIDGGDDYTGDGSVDLKGRPALRHTSGRWKACSFIVGYEVFERMAYYGIASNLVVYLTKKLHEGTVKSSNNVTNWVGTVWMTPLLGAYIADTYLGRYWTFLYASAIYIMGMALLTLTVSIPALKPPSCPGIKDEDCNKRASTLQVGLFYSGLYIIAVGTGGTKPNISTMGADQFDDFEPKERKHKLSFFNWWMFSIFLGTLFSNSFLIYLQDKVSFSIGYGLPTLGLIISVLVFLVGTPFYRHKLVTGSPVTKMAQVVVAAFRKWKLHVPDDPKELHELSMEEYEKYRTLWIDHTTPLRFLDKAAVKAGSISPWMLSPVTQVEETKQMVKMVPILLVCLIPSVLVAQVGTLFVKQGTTLERHMGPKFEIPPACLSVFVTISMLITIVVYDRYFVPFARRYTDNPRGITMLQRMGIGLVLQVIVMITACLAERKRLSVAREHGIFTKNGQVPLSIFILLPQFALMGVADNFLEVAKLEFFYDQAPQGMKSIGTAYFSISLGVGNFLGSLLLTIISNVTKRRDEQGWILDNLNMSRLDNYYALLAALGCFNFAIFLYVASKFKYNADRAESRGKMQEVGQGLTD